MLCTKCILSKRKPEDGLRISVMSRHMLNDGVTPDERIVDYDFQVSILGSSSIGKYCRKELEWGEFEALYLEELRTDPKRQHVIRLANICLSTMSQGSILGNHSRRFFHLALLRH